MYRIGAPALRQLYEGMGCTCDSVDKFRKRGDKMLDVEQAIRYAQAQMIHKNQPPAALGGMLVAVLCVLVYWNVASRAGLLLWFGALALVIFVRMLRWRTYRGAKLLERGPDKWLRETVWSCGATGALFGAGALIMMPPDLPVYQVTYGFSLFAMAVASMFSYNVHYPTFMAFYIPTVPVGMIALAAQQTPLTWGVAGGMFLFTIVVFQSMGSLNHAFLEAQKLRFQNADLVVQLTAQKNAAVAANLAKSRFLAAASHDLRQPMHALSLYLATLHGLALPSAVRPVLDNVDQCAQTMEKMFSGLLDISRLDAGTVLPEIEDFPIALVLDRIRIEFAPMARDRWLELRIAPSGAFVRSDPALIGRILRNLVANAIRYTHSGKVLVGCRRSGGLLRLSVYDTGPGVAAEHLAKIFEEFYQIDPSQRVDAGGLGLGLAIVDRLAKLLRAPLVWYSKPGQGSMFALDIPLANAIAAAVPPDAGPQRGHDFAGCLIVVIDDNPQVLDATRSLLESWGCDVVSAVSGADALRQFSTIARVPRALVCDYRLSAGESGIAVIERLRHEFNKAIPALLITGDTGPEQIVEIGASGLPVLYKPLRVDELRRQMDQLLAERQLSPGA